MIVDQEAILPKDLPVCSVEALERLWSKGVSNRWCFGVEGKACLPVIVPRL